MSALENATQFFHACESLKGFSGCRPYVSPGATFDAQCEPLVELKTVEDYTNWMQAVGNGPLQGCSYELKSASFDPVSRQALFFGLFLGTHRGEGGPVPATHKSTRSDYVYVLTMGADDKVTHMTKVWNAPWALRELGWM